MSIAFVADVHVASHRLVGGPWEAGVNARGRAVVGCLRRALCAASEAGAAAFVVLGDLFDTTRPEPQLIASVARVLAGWSGFPIVLLKGNHDSCSATMGDHALGPLGELPGVQVVDVPEVLDLGGQRVLLVPFLPGPASEVLPRVLATFTETDVDVVGLHVGLRDAELSRQPWAAAAEDAIAVEALAEVVRPRGARVVVAGNWHSARAWRVGELRLHQVGALCPTGWDNPGLEGYGGVTLVGRSGVTRLEVVGPRFVTVSSAAELAAVVAAAPVDGALYVRWTCVPSGVDEARATLEACGAQLAGWDVRLDGGEAQSRAVAAASAVRATSTLAGALEAYVARAAFPEGVDRGVVLARCRALLGVV